ncbi:very short patch repair endonuclease [uncultured Trichococcus sp.]|mgnify:CR=1 FL=1|jgi:DNA mismatch endonuclease (patch repair protein)|uniref:very short patch repair endonuclease n=1 Tax=uncultured Trichococcus sp. TaxID=189665 RepID=UPI0029C8E3B9|nr:very short patch repair endonuclease [uncultured Trichococcus sp.]
MADKITSEQRRKNMQAIKSHSKLEELVTKELWKKGVRYRRNSHELLGKPDVSIKKYRLVIFIDSCFWHSCPIHGKVPKTNVEFWEKKLRKNKERDNLVNNYYRTNGWHVIRIWEHEIHENLEVVIENIITTINLLKNS